MRNLIRAGLCLSLALTIVMPGLCAGTQQPTAADLAVSEFNKRVKQYMESREKAAAQLPKLAEDSKPEEIEAYFVSLQAGLSATRTGAKPGDIFIPAVTAHFRRVIKREFTGERLLRLREKIREADAKGVPLRVNARYPETKEVIEMPPTLLLNLPGLPKQLHYHFVGRALVLVDKEARMIIDYMPNALP